VAKLCWKYFAIWISLNHTHFCPDITLSSWLNKFQRYHILGLNIMQTKGGQLVFDWDQLENFWITRNWPVANKVTSTIANECHEMQHFSCKWICIFIYHTFNYIQSKAVVSCFGYCNISRYHSSTFWNIDWKMFLRILSVQCKFRRDRPT